jgi:Tfp pilus assembly protein PilO
MTARDRLIVTFVVAFALLGAVYVMLVSPERKKAATVSTELSAATSRLQAAEGKLAEARQAQSRYASAYASIVSLGKAVPTSEEVPSLIYQLAQATHEKDVQFASIASGTGAAATPAAGPATAAAASAGFTQVPFTFVFNGTYKQLESLFATVDRNVVRSASGQLDVSGRLLTIQSAKLGPLPTPGSTTPTSNKLTGTITATAYVLGAGQSLTAGATAASPAGSSTPASSSGSSNAPAPAIARVTP